MSRRKSWNWVTGLATAGMLDSLYLFLFQTGEVKKIVCPVFGGGCEKVAGSPLARPAGIPDAIFGVIGYAAAAFLGLAIPRTHGKLKIILASALIAGTIGAMALSVYLVHAQKTQTHAWCFWCLMSAGLSTTLALIAVPACRRAIRKELDRCRHREGEQSL